mmetsp:Transcript_43994/g.133245  ORF Transcript_43994/g.133245 Transcript_43994/m.133245 type:complete len:227 (-) Transcript_43994:174-854(-)
MPNSPEPSAFGSSPASLPRSFQTCASVSLAYVARSHASCTPSILFFSRSSTTPYMIFSASSSARPRRTRNNSSASRPSGLMMSRRPMASSTAPWYTLPNALMTCVRTSESERSRNRRTASKAFFSGSFKMRPATRASRSLYTINAAASAASLGSWSCCKAGCRASYASANGRPSASALAMASAYRSRKRGWHTSSRAACSSAADICNIATTTSAGAASLSSKLWAK